jgi:hypothetical protein
MISRVRRFPVFYPHAISKLASALVSIKYQAKGPTLRWSPTVSTATNAIGEAFRAFRHGYAESSRRRRDACINPIAMGGFANCMACPWPPTPTRPPIPSTAAVPARHGRWAGGGRAGGIAHAAPGAPKFTEICATATQATPTTSPRPSSYGEGSAP